MENIDSTEELRNLISYLVKHNESHTKELAISLKSAEDSLAYNDVISAIEYYKKGNEKLSSSSKKISK